MIIFVAYFGIDKIWFIYGLLGLGWLFFTGLANDIVERISGSIKKCDSNLGSESKYDLVSFNDAVANELMRIRSDLVNIKIKQSNLGWNNISKDFLQMFWTFNVYPSSFLCTYLETPEDYANSDSYQGKIILILENDINLDYFWEVKFDAEALRKLNSIKRSKIESGMAISVFVCEDKNDTASTSERSAEVLSIQKDGWLDDICVTLEINLDTVWDHLQWRPEEYVGRHKIIRKIKVSTYRYDNNYCDFVLDKKEVDSKSITISA